MRLIGARFQSALRLSFRAMSLPITFDDILGASERLRRYLMPTPLRGYPLLDDAIGHGVRVLVKHENFQPTGAFKVRNGLNAVLALNEEPRRRGVVAASTGNHGQGLAWAGLKVGAPVTICVPEGNNPDKNAAIRAMGATLVESGRDYVAAVDAAEALRRERGLTLVHSTENRDVLAGAATIGLEILEERPDVHVIIAALGGGSQAVGAIAASRGLGAETRVIAAQALGASAGHDSWHAKQRLTTEHAATFAEGVATRTTYDLTFDALVSGLSDFVTVSDAEIADGMRLALSATHTLVEPAGAVGLAALRRLAPSLEGCTVAIIFSGANVDGATLTRVINREI